MEEFSTIAIKGKKRLSNDKRLRGNKMDNW